MEQSISAIIIDAAVTIYNSTKSTDENALGQFIISISSVLGIKNLYVESIMDQQILWESMDRLVYSRNHHDAANIQEIYNTIKHADDVCTSKVIYLLAILADNKDIADKYMMQSMDIDDNQHHIDNSIDCTFTI